MRSRLPRYVEGQILRELDRLELIVEQIKAVEAYRRLIELKMPTNMRAMVLPELESFSQFPARGPEGVKLSDIYRRAAGIECYLDLSLPNYPPAQVVWTNYKTGLDTWHGALEQKDSYAQHFYKQDDADLIAGSYDTTKRRAILYALLREATSLSEIPKWLRQGE